MSKIKCILIDDELPNLAYLKVLVEQLPDVEIVKVYNQSSKFVLEYKNFEFDLVISDIQMPDIDGLALANIMSDKQFIFTTAYREFAVEAFDLNAVDYLTKPIRKERLEKAILKVKSKSITSVIEPTFCSITTDRGKLILYFSEVLYIKVSNLDARDKVAYLQNGTEVVLKNITYKELNLILPSSLFCQINKAEIISYKIVSFYTSDNITSNIKVNNKFLEFTLSPNFIANFKLK